MPLTSDGLRAVSTDVGRSHTFTLWRGITGLPVHARRRARASAQRGLTLALRDMRILRAIAMDLNSHKSYNTNEFIT